MPIYQYRAFGKNEEMHKGTHDAASEGEVHQFLRTQNLYPIEIKPTRFSKHKKKGNLPGGSKKENSLLKGSIKFKALDLKKWFPYQKKYHTQVAGFTRQLETLLEVTIPYDKALEMIIAQTPDHSFQSILSDIRSRVVEGSHLAEAMGHYPHVFPPMYVSMVRAGENGGTLGMIMSRLAIYYENQEKLRSKLKSAMIYPIFMMGFCLLVVTFMMLYIVPKITAIFEARDTVLPLATRILIAISGFLTNHWLLSFFGLIALISGSVFYFRTPHGILFKDRMAITLPLIKKLVIKVLVLRFCQTLGTLLKTGVDLKSSLEISKHVVVNHIFLGSLNQLIIDVNNKGLPLSAAMRRIPFFPEYVCHVVAIGEQAAKVDDLLEKVAERMQMEVSHTMEGLTSLLQPVMILIMGGIVAFIALAILLPMLSMNQLL
ncbi:MAG: type II secretion system F family protein [SAR324 cluster bacterium]|nr:type II secretion system F family protein [SAR324 cluster bacterium]